MRVRELVFAGLAAHLAHVAEAGATDGKPGYGFIGYGIEMYKPPCAFACRDVITAPLNCTDADMGHHDNHSDSMKMKRMSGMGGDSDSAEWESGEGWMVMPPTPACKVNDDFFLQTLAHCMKTYCAGVSIAKLETFWLDYTAGRKLGQPVPKKSYGDALNAITSTPTRELNNSILLNYTAVITHDQWFPTYSALVNFEDAEIAHARYGLVVLLTSAIIPIGISLLRFFPWPASWVARVNGYLIDPPLFGSKHISPVFWGLGIMPTRGQALFIAYLWTINVVLSAVGYEIMWPHNWFETKQVVLLSYISNRVGILSFANLPLIVLYSGRNNVLLWVTNWSHSTFLLLHRWIAAICTLQAVLHSILYLYLYDVIPGRDHDSQSQLPYWYWGIIGTLALCIAIPASILPIRQRLYELFLASHIVLAILALLGCFLHIWYRYALQWGYDTWIYIAVAIWLFDRLARVARATLGRSGGLKRAHVTDIDGEYYRIDVPSVVVRDGHVYLHFPTISGWRVWENHPFSVAGITSWQGSVTSLLPGKNVGSVSATRIVAGGEKCAGAIHHDSRSRSSDSLPSASPTPSTVVEGDVATTFLVRKHEGITSTLASTGRAAGTAGIPVLVEGIYGRTAGGGLHDEFPSGDFPHVLCIAGGVGITAVLPLLDRAGGGAIVAPAMGGSAAKVYWGVRSAGLVRGVEDMLGVCGGGDEVAVGSGAGELRRKWGPVEVVVSVGDRLNLRKVLESEIRSRNRGTTVVVCGPAGMADDVRCIVAALSRQPSVLVRLVVESFSW